MKLVNNPKLVSPSALSLVGGWMRAAFVLLAASGSAFSEEEAAEAPTLTFEQTQFFESKIRPIFVNSCLECHSAEKGKVKAGLNMDTRRDLLKGGENGAIIAPGDPRGSVMIKAVEWSEDLQMPPKKKLSDEEIDALKQWVEMGAPDPREGSTGSGISKKDHWAFQPVTRPKAPQVKNENWCKTSIDKFVMAKLEEKEMLPADPSDTGTDEERRTKREALLRRAYFDLIGFPPSPKEIHEFTNDRSPDAFEKVIDRLLASPAYGERWARHWMDTARYSDTTGEIRPGSEYRYSYAWSYRDWLINAINKDMPYDQFIINQLAADKVTGNDPVNLAALGFLTVGQRFPSGEDVINDRIDVVGRGMLGLTLACARCHDHKFDPVTIADYYALHGVFASSVEPGPGEGPLIGGDPQSESYKAFEKKFFEWEKAAVNAFVQYQQEIYQGVRSKAGGYLELGVWMRRGLEENRKVIDEIVAKHRLEVGAGGNLGNAVVGRSHRNDPVLGPFVALIDSPNPAGELEKMKKQVAPRNEVGPGYNPVVIDFLSTVGRLPNDLGGAGALFEKMFREKVDPHLGAPTGKAEDVPNRAKYGIYSVIADPATTPEHPDRALMELAVWPTGLVVGSQMEPGKNLTHRRLREQIGAYAGLGRDVFLAARIRDSYPNELRLTFRGGPVRAMALMDSPNPKDSPIYPRGNPPRMGDFNTKIVPRRFIDVLAGEGGAEPFSEGSGRYELARAIGSNSNPLTARVMVNRIWYYLFGEGLVRTPDDLGNQSGTPSHQELLDFLSAWFMDDYGQGKPAWSRKSLIKAVMMSNTYQQSSRTFHMARQKDMDPSNRLLWRANVRRLDFEAFRDSMLSMGNMMDRKMFGPPVNIVSEPFSYRRSVYGYLDRKEIPDLMAQFDMVNSVEPNTKRTSTIVPQQALFLMNSPFVVSVAKQVARRPEVVEAVVQRKDPRAGIIAIFQIVLQRTPSKAEFDMAVQFLQKQSKIQQQVEQAVVPTLAEAAKKAQAAVDGARASAASDKPPVNEGTIFERTPMTPWESLVQALMFCNEATYLN